MTVISLTRLHETPIALESGGRCAHRAAAFDAVRAALGRKRYGTILAIGTDDASLASLLRCCCDRLATAPAKDGPSFDVVLDEASAGRELVVLGPEVFRLSADEIDRLAARLDAARPRARIMTLTDCRLDLPGYDGDVAFASFVRATLRTWRTKRLGPGWRVAAFDPLTRLAPDRPHVSLLEASGPSAAR
jgi:hypothetical protein